MSIRPLVREASVKPAGLYVSSQKCGWLLSALDFYGTLQKALYSSNVITFSFRVWVTREILFQNLCPQVLFLDAPMERMHLHTKEVVLRHLNGFPGRWAALEPCARHSPHWLGRAE